MSELPPLEPELLPDGVRACFVDGINGLRMHVLEAGFAEPGRPCVLLLHGFPELAYSWRKVMPALAAAGLHVLAPDQRGYGRTTGWDPRYDRDLPSYRMLNLVRDAMSDMNVELEYQLRRKMKDMLQSTSTTAPEPGKVETEDLGTPSLPVGVLKAPTP